VLAAGWVRVRLAASVAGFAIASYLSILHYDAAIPLACSSSGEVNCERVLTSPYAVVGELPVAAWGAGWFAVAAVLSLLSAARGGVAGTRWVDYLALTWATAGAAVVLRLVYVELAVIGNICLWCTVVHVLVIGIFVIQVLTVGDRAAGQPASLRKEGKPL
jgi:uncharacterized membrane protein